MNLWMKYFEKIWQKSLLADPLFFDGVVVVVVKKTTIQILSVWITSKWFDDQISDKFVWVKEKRIEKWKHC